MSSLMLNQDGRPEFFVIGEDKAVWHQWADKTGTLGSWVSLGGQWKQLAVASNQDKRIEVFAIGFDDAVWHCGQTTPNGAFGSWSSLLGDWKQMTTASNQDGRIELFAIGFDDAVWHRRQLTPNGDFGNWASLGAKVKQIKANRQPNGVIQVIALGVDLESYRIVQKAPNDDWKDWERLFMQGGMNLSGHSSVTFEVGDSGSKTSELFLASVAETPSAPSGLARAKTRDDLVSECRLEMVNAALAIAGVVAAAAPAVAAGPPGLLGVAVGLGLALTQLNSATNKCAEIIESLPSTPSASANGLDKGGAIHGVEGGHIADFTPGQGAGFNVA